MGMWSVLEIKKILNEPFVKEPNSIFIRNLLQKEMLGLYEAVIRKSGGYLLCKRPRKNVKKDVTIIGVRNSICPAELRDWDLLTKLHIDESREKGKSYCRIMVMGTKFSEATREYCDRAFIDVVFLNRNSKQWEHKFAKGGRS